MTFSLKITYNSTIYTFQVESVQVSKELSKSFERFKLSAGNRVVILQSNRPMLQTKGLKHKPITWKVVEGEVKDNKALEKVIAGLLQHLNNTPSQTTFMEQTIDKPAKATWGQAKKTWQKPGSPWNKRLKG